MMTKNDRLKITKEKEMRTKEISKMISEGGLGSEKYYDIEKKNTPKTSSEENTNK